MFVRQNMAWVINFCPKKFQAPWIEDFKNCKPQNSNATNEITERIK
jgi:hypothetical protein